MDVHSTANEFTTYKIERQTYIMLEFYKGRLLFHVTGFTFDPI